VGSSEISAVDSDGRAGDEAGLETCKVGYEARDLDILTRLDDVRRDAARAEVARMPSRQGGDGPFAHRVDRNARDARAVGRERGRPHAARAMAPVSGPPNVSSTS
jgi:hypothetical protein